MTVRTTGETVTFAHPFRLSGADDLQPAGSYFVETDEELLQSLSLPAYRRVSTFIHLAGRPNSTEVARVVTIDPAELAAAQAIDAQTPVAAASLPTPVAHQETPGAQETMNARWTQWLVLNATELKLAAMVAGGVALAGLFA